MTDHKQPTKPHALFKHATPGVLALHKQANKDLRKIARADWWAKNKPVK